MTDTTPDAPISCPECHGAQLIGHPAGRLTIQHSIDCSILRAEDATKAADAERMVYTGGLPFVRYSTDAERTLLVANGVAHDEQLLLTLLVPVAGRAVLRRCWPTVWPPEQPEPPAAEPVPDYDPLPEGFNGAVDLR